MDNNSGKEIKVGDAVTFTVPDEQRARFGVIKEFKMVYDKQEGSSEDTRPEEVISSPTEVEETDCYVYLGSESEESSEEDFR